MKELVNTVAETSLGKTDTLVNEVVEVIFEIVLGNGTLDVIPKVFQQFFPVDAPKVGEVEDGLQVLGNLQKGDVVETEGAVGHDILELLTQRLHILRGLQQIAAPIEGG